MVTCGPAAVLLEFVRPNATTGSLAVDFSGLPVRRITVIPATIAARAAAVGAPQYHVTPGASTSIWGLLGPKSGSSARRGRATSAAGNPRSSASAGLQFGLQFAPVQLSSPVFAHPA